MAEDVPVIVRDELNSARSLVEGRCLFRCVLIGMDEIEGLNQNHLSTDNMLFIFFSYLV